MLFAEREALCRQPVKPKGDLGVMRPVQPRAGVSCAGQRDRDGGMFPLRCRRIANETFSARFVRDSGHFFMDATESHRFCQSADFLPGRSTSSVASAASWRGAGCHVCWHA